MIMFKGTYTAIVTPFHNERMDEKALEKLVKAQIRAGVDGIVPTGTTGESPTLDYEEHVRVIELCVDIAQGRIRVLAGTGANSTAEAVYLTRAAAEVGADGTLQVAPYYNKPTQEGLFEHFQAIARSVRFPVILYSIPGRCGVEIGVETLQRLQKKCKNVVGIKEAGGRPDRVSQMREVLGKDFAILSGDDSMTLPFMSVGADGVISVASNIIPKDVSKLVRSFKQGQVKVAQRLHAKYFPLFKNLFLETNPIPIKAAMAMMNMIHEEYRLPLVKMGLLNREKLAETLKSLNLI